MAMKTEWIKSGVDFWKANLTSFEHVHMPLRESTWGVQKRKIDTGWMNIKMDCDQDLILIIQSG